MIRPRSVELFAGGGGLALGLHNAGFEHVALVEREHQACLTLRRNAERWAATGRRHAPWTADAVIEADVRDDATWAALRDIGPIDLVAGGPPCQPFSLGGVHAGTSDERNMFPAALDVVRALRPKIVIFENVPGLLRRSFLPYFEYVEEQLRWPTTRPKAGETWQRHYERLLRRERGPRETRYVVTRQIINAADHGVPQARRRVFLMALRRDLVDGPLGPAPVTPTHSVDALRYAQWVEPTYWDEHGLEPRPRPDDLTDEAVHRMKLDGPPRTRRWFTVRDALAGNVELAGIESRLPEPVEGCETPGVRNHVGVAGARSYPGHTGSDIDWPAKTVKAGVHGVCGGEAMTRYEDGSLRYWTVRESARIQSFPDGYEFVGARSNAMRHIGNAVAVEVARVVGRTLREIAEV